MVEAVKEIAKIDEIARQLEKLIENGRLADAAERIINIHPADGAEILLRLDLVHRVALISSVPPFVAAAILEQLHEEEMAQIVLAMDAETVIAVLEVMPPEIAADLLGELEDTLANEYLEQMDDSSQVAPLLAYDEESAGGIMHPIGPMPQRHMTVAQATEFLRMHYKDQHELYYLYVIDEAGHLIGIANLRSVILASPEQTMEELMETEIISVTTHTDQEDVARLLARYDLLALPVVDGNNLLVGIVTHDDLVDVVEEEATEDFHKFGSIQNIVFNPVEATVLFLYRKRIVWLFALVFMNIFSGAAIATFEETIEAMVSLVFFLPLLIDSGGNAGSQSATLMIRALATGDVRMRDWFRLVGKELAVALLLGLTMAAGVAAIASYRAPDILVIVALTMTCVVLIGSIVGMTLPFIFTRLKMDPAAASAPLITSIADICGVLIYFSIATTYLNLTT